MNKISKNRWILVTLGHYILLFSLSQLNHYLAPVHTYLTLIGLAISYSVIRLSLKQGLLSLIPIAFYLDCTTPLIFGTSLLMIVSLFCTMFLFRSRFQRETITTSIFISLILNSAMISAYTISAISQFGYDSVNISLTLWNLLWSSLVIVLIHQLYYHLIDSLLARFGIHIAEEQREAK